MAQAPLKTPSASFHGSQTGIRFSVPGDWTLTAQGPSADAEQFGFANKSLHADLFVWLKSQSVPQADITARLQSQIEFKANQRAGIPGYKMLRDTLRRRFVGGRPAVSIEAEYHENGVRMIEYQTFVISEQAQAYISVRMRAEDLENTKRQVDAILATFAFPE